MEITCDDYIKTHPYRFCREVCSESAVDPDSYRICVDECVREIEERCR